MKKFTLVLVAALVLLSGAFAQSAPADRMLIAPGSSNVTIGFDFGLGVNAGFEVPLGYFDAGTLRFSYGAKAIANAWFGGSVTGLGVGAVGTLHFAWGCLDLPNNLSWLNNIDTFIGLGLGYSGFAYNSGFSGSIGIFSHGGTSYFFRPNMAVTVAGGIGGSYLGILWKL